MRKPEKHNLKDVNKATTLNAAVHFKVESNQKAFWLIDVSYQRMWSELSKTIIDLGFAIEDWDRTEGLYYIQLKSSEQLGDSINESVLEPLKKQILRFKITELSRQKVKLELLDENLQPIDVATIKMLNSELKSSLERHVN